VTQVSLIGNALWDTEHSSDNQLRALKQGQCFLAGGVSMTYQAKKQ
jgi:hypothetical protein